jgi:transcriptional regulator with XRE-family HTH domain
MTDSNEHSPPPAVPIDAALRTSLRRIRELYGLSQRDLSERMAEAGFPWTHSTVSSVEGGRRSLTAAELIALWLVVLPPDETPLREWLDAGSPYLRLGEHELAVAEVVETNRGPLIGSDIRENDRARDWVEDQLDRWERSELILHGKPPSEPARRVKRAALWRIADEVVDE